MRTMFLGKALTIALAGFLLAEVALAQESRTATHRAVEDTRPMVLIALSRDSAVQAAPAEGPVHVLLVRGADGQLSTVARFPTRQALHRDGAKAGPLEVFGWFRAGQVARAPVYYYVARSITSGRPGAIPGNGAEDR